MSFPVDGTAAEIGNWLRIEDFDESIIQSFVKWNANNMLGATEIDLPGKEGRRLWALLNTARSLQGRFVAYSSLLSPFFR